MNYDRSLRNHLRQSDNGRQREKQCCSHFFAVLAAAPISWPYSKSGVLLPAFLPSATAQAEPHPFEVIVFPGGSNSPIWAYEASGAVQLTDTPSSSLPTVVAQPG